MKKKVVVNSLKSLAIAATFAFGVSAFGTTADAAIIPTKAPVKTVDPEAMDETVINYKKSTLLGIGLSGSLLQPLLGDVQVDVGVQKDVETTEGTLSTGGLVQADITDSGLLGNTHVGVAEKTHIETDDYTYDYSGLAQVDIEGSVVGDAHVAVEVITQLTTSPLFNVVVVNVALFVPTFVEPTFHWYDGVPPFVGVAVNVTDVPEQIVVPEPLAILTDGVTALFTVIVTLLEVAVNGDAQDEFEVITQLTTSPLFNVVVVNVALFVPTFVEPTFHW